MSNYDEFDLDVKNIKINGEDGGERAGVSTAVLSYVTGIISGAVVGTYTGECLSKNCGTSEGCGTNPTHYSC
ncbi:MAG: hypothetical protein RSD47_06860 [Romboutsia sp.]